MARQLVFFAYDEAKNAGPYDERPMLPSNVDLQIHMSRNDRRQPFFLICQHDCVLVTMSGTGEVEYKDAPVLRQAYELGDFIYVPAGTPHRIVPETESLHLRYKLPESDREGVAWYCDGCGRELHRVVWDLKEFTGTGRVSSGLHVVQCRCGPSHLQGVRRCPSAGRSRRVPVGGRGRGAKVRRARRGDAAAASARLAAAVAPEARRIDRVRVAG